MLKVLGLGINIMTYFMGRGLDRENLHVTDLDLRFIKRVLCTRYGVFSILDAMDPRCDHSCVRDPHRKVIYVI